ncbi:uncharacterized protein Dana_GF10984 [Drosophila ananassae]|uniref:MD-2-related lipid-recognition domain-containing protein n=1 Tax=Drosophila ananassae TaxID=7217 RepID=B3MB63_DROAN|nr:uncharacterized protein LOC6493850 [Drosophila ananassae]EDV41364.2 uncharacterized protein Dana_GF10984 [Drosophila ananassae]
MARDSLVVAILIESCVAPKMTFRTGDCKYDKTVFSNFSIQIINTKLMMDMILVSTLPPGLKAHLSFEFRLSKSKPYQSVYQHDMNYCALIKGAQQSIYRRWFTSMLKVGNFATSCPIKQGYYYMHGWTLDANYVPSFFYVGDYRICGSFFYGRFKKNVINPMLECSVEAVLN